MANKTVSNLNELTTVSNSDVLLVETATETFKVTKGNLLKEVNQQLNAKSDADHTHDEYVTETELNSKGLATETFVTNRIADVESRIGDLSQANTNNKSNLVEIINELLGRINGSVPPAANIPVESVDLNHKKLRITEGESAKLIAAITPENATNTNLIWSSSDDSKLSVDNGTITALLKGEVVVTVRTEDGNKEASCQVIVDELVTSGVDIRYLNLEREETQLTMPNELLMNGEIDVVHPSALYFEHGWNGYKYWMAINPYPKTQSSYENPCMIVSNDGSNWTVKGDVPIYGVMEGAVHNSDCHIFMDGNTMVYLNRGATNGSCMIEYFTSTDGENWSERTKIIDEAVGHNYLSPSVCKYNNEWYMFVYDSKTDVTADERKMITVLKSDGAINGNWSVVNTINVTNVDTIWHLEVKYIDGDFIALIMTGSATGGNLSLSKFKTPMDSEISDFIKNPIITATGSSDEAVLYKSTIIKKTRKLYEVFVNSKSKGTLDAFCHWSLNKSTLTTVEPSTEIGVEFDSGVTEIDANQITSVNNVFRFKELPSFNYKLEFTISDATNSAIHLKSQDTAQYCQVVFFSQTSALEYWKSGKKIKSVPLLCNVTNDTKFTFITKDGISSLYIDDRLMAVVNENELASNYDIHVRKIGYDTKYSGMPNAITVSYRHEDLASIDLATKELEDYVNGYSLNPQGYLAYDNFERANGALGNSVCGKAWTTDGTPFSISNNMAKGNMGCVSCLNIASDDYSMIADLYPGNYHRIYIKYVDSNNNVFLSFNANDGFSVVKTVDGATIKSYYWLHCHFNERNIVKVNKSGIVYDIYLNNQHIYEFNLEEFSDNNVIGIGARLANTSFNSIIVKKLTN